MLTRGEKTNEVVLLHRIHEMIAETYLHPDFPSTPCRNLVHGKLSLDAEKLEVTVLLGRLPSTLEASLRLLVDSAKVKGTRTRCDLAGSLQICFVWETTLFAFTLLDHEVFHKYV